MEQNYLPLFRKYRPQSFKDIVGQESLVKALSNAIELNRIANAYLFCGPRGTGKTSSARIFAKSLNCIHGPTLEPCQKCASCVDITNATGLDVIEIDAASNRGIQDAKDLILQVQYAPINGKYKIFIIDEVHALSTDAFNALLKTFEEPPKNVIFILATTEPHKVLETIVSRCQRFDLKRITIEDIIKKLREIADLEKIKITDEALFTIAKNVSGGLRDSLALLDQVSILGVKEEIGKELIEELLGKINFDILLNLLNDISSSNVEKAINDVETIYTKGNEPKNLVENFIEFLRNVILILNSSDDELISKCTTMIKTDIDKVRSLNFDKDKTVKILNTMVEYYKEIKLSTNPYLWAEIAVISSCRLDVKNVKTVQTQPSDMTSHQEIKKVSLEQPQIKTVISQTEIKNTAQKPEIQSEIKPNQTINEQAQTPKENLEKDGAEIWTNIVQSISSPPTRAFFTGVARLVKVENKKITLGFFNDNLISQAKSESKTNWLKKAMNAVCPDYEFEIIKINSDTKTISVNIKSAKAPANPLPQAKIISNEKETSNINLQNNNVQNPITQEQKILENEEENPKKPEKSAYSEQVQSMIEQFNGRIIE